MSASHIPSYKLNTDKGDLRFIKDGMNELERNTKRMIDLFTSGI